MARILVVDDDADIRLLLRLELSAEGHQIVEAENGQIALDLLATEPVDLMVLDIMMPVLDGRQVLAQLELDAPPVIVITAHAHEQGWHMAELLESGALDVVVKPFDPGYLIELADAVILVEPAERAEYRRRRLAQVTGE